jgi:hypothetical protein
MTKNIKKWPRKTSENSRYFNFEIPTDTPPSPNLPATSLNRTHDVQYIPLPSLAYGWLTDRHEDHPADTRARMYRPALGTRM